MGELFEYHDALGEIHLQYARRDDGVWFSRWTGGGDCRWRRAQNIPVNSDYDASNLPEKLQLALEPEARALADTDSIWLFRVSNVQPALPKD
jgi:hypothetical protein